MKIFRRILIVLMTLSLLCPAALGESAADAVRNTKGSDGILTIFPAGTNPLVIEEMAGENPNVTSVRILGVDAPKADTPLDTSATVRALIGGQAASWELPVVWLDKNRDVVETARAGMILVPVITFFLPEDSVFDGVIELDMTLAALIPGRIWTLYEPAAGIVYIFGRPTGSLNASPAASVPGNAAGTWAAPSGDTQDTNLYPAPTEKPEPIEERSPVEIFAETYQDDYANIDWAAAEEMLGGDLTQVDWNELIHKIGYFDFQKVIEDSGLQDYYVSKTDDFFGFMDEIFHPTHQLMNAFVDEQSEYAQNAPEELQNHVSNAQKSTVLGLYDHDNLLAMVDVIKNQVQPRAISLLMNNFEAFASADPDAFSPSCGLEISMRGYMGSYGAVFSLYDEEKQMGFKMSLGLNRLNTEYDGSHQRLDTETLDDELIYTIVHENMHLIMYDYNRPLLDDYNGLPYGFDENWKLSYDTPNYGTVTADEYSAILDTVYAPVWFSEGIAHAVGGFYATYTGYHQSLAAETEQGFVYSPDTLYDDYFNHVGDMTNPKQSSTANTLYGPVAAMYLGELILRHDGSTAVTRNEDGQVTHIDSLALNAGLSKLLEGAHNGTTLDELIYEYTDGAYQSMDDFGSRYFMGADGQGDEESLQFAADVLNYLEKLSVEQGALVSGSILVGFDENLVDQVMAQDGSGSNYYRFTDSGDPAPSAVSTEDASTQGGKSEFDLDAYRAEHAADDDGDDDGEPVDDDDDDDDDDDEPAGDVSDDDDKEPAENAGDDDGELAGETSEEPADDDDEPAEVADEEGDDDAAAGPSENAEALAEEGAETPAGSENKEPAEEADGTQGADANAAGTGTEEPSETAGGEKPAGE